ncbi:MAG TPA: peptidoglycan DD-metalloendopeptidase family protein [Pseudomonadales bacterium]
MSATAARIARAGRRGAALALLALLAAGPAAAAEDESAAAEAELSRITAELNDLNAWLGSAERKRAEWQRDIQAHDREVARLSREVDAAAAALAEVRAEQQRLEAERDALEARRRAEAERIGGHLASAHRLGGQDFVKLLLNEQSPAEIDRLMRYHRYFTEARMAVLDDYRRTLADLDATRRRLEERAAAGAARQEALRRQQAALVEKRKERQTLLARLNAEAEDKEARRQRLLADQNRLETLLREIERRARELDGRAFAERKGSLPWPIDGRLRNAFGQPRPEGRLIWHGLLLAADEGTPVRSVFRGRVVFANWLRGFGLLTIVDHGSGYMTLYGQADTLLKKVGDWVESGEEIARAGRSGGSDVSGLYFEIRHEGRALDPVSWLSRR